MNKDEIVEYIVDRINANEDQYQIEASLKRKEIDPAQFDSLMDQALARILEHKLKTYPRQNIIRFTIWTILLLFFSALFFFILPGLGITRNTITLSILGTICLSVSLLNVFIYYGSWRKRNIEKYGKPKPPIEGYLVISFFPGFIFYFIISSCFSSGADKILKETQQDAVATVIDGSSIEGRINYATVTVEFMTKDGRVITAVEDVSTYEFKDFYQGQKLNIVYSKNDPHNIDLLIDNYSVLKYKNKLQREIEPKDLLNLSSVSFENLGAELNKINNNWVYNDSEGVWIDEKRQQIISTRKKPDQVILMMPRGYGNDFDFANKFLKIGFVKINTQKLDIEADPAETIYIKDDYLASFKIVNKNFKSNLIIVVEKLKK
ncbi:hypothetical protein [Flavobacterium sp. HJJ]|uniref:hypothetical protein n=1 Tax=Flavobacterium sp. HJJ TaxID=2783792 RepID=UPI00188DC637|nr:hypothetical protein [Flavobacterium sp. HJJ]MBF4472424.1 hypothetical protein [Flavobacterium sp. HJJ]